MRKLRAILLLSFLILAFVAKAQKNSCTPVTRLVTAEVQHAVDSSSALLFDLCQAESGCFEECLHQFVLEGGNVNAVDSTGSTLLDYAFTQRNADQVIWIMKAGGHLQMVQVDDDMYHFLSTGNEYAVRKLLNHTYMPPLRRAFLYDFVWPTISAGYLQGTWGMPHISFACNFHKDDYFPLSHYGFRAGTFAGLRTNPVKLAPFVAVEYRYVVFIGRAGCMFPFQQQASYVTPYAEAGFSLWSLLDITYMYCFSNGQTLNRMRGGMLNVQLSVPIVKWGNGK